MKRIHPPAFQSNLGLCLKATTLLALLLAAGCGGPPVDSIEWTTMGTAAKVSFKDGDLVRLRQAQTQVLKTFAEVEEKLSIWEQWSRELGVSSPNYFTSCYLTPLAAAGFIVSEGASRSPQRTYRLTAKGRRVLA